MKLFKSFTAIALGGLLVAAPMTQFFGNISIDAIHAQSQITESKTLVALGGSLNESQAEQTLSILGAHAVPTNELIEINGSLINQYLADGSTDATPVYSSVAIEPRDEGYGVQVQILTPNTILSVASQTYQNAAITAGASNVLIKIAAVEPVTGEGALTGVYRLYESTGQQLSQANIELAQKEISLVETIKEEAGLDDATINQIQALIKQAISTSLIANGALSDEDVTVLVDQILTNYQSENDLVIDENARAKFVAFALDYAQSEVALDDDTAQQIEDSTSSTWTLESAVDFWEASILNPPFDESYVNIENYDRSNWSVYDVENLREGAIVIYLANENGEGSYWDLIRTEAGTVSIKSFVGDNAYPDAATHGYLVDAYDFSMIEENPIVYRDGTEEVEVAWGEVKAAALSEFMDSWGESMGQYYKAYDLYNTTSMWGIEFPTDVIDVLAVNGEAVTAEWYYSSDDSHEYRILAAYTDQEYLRETVEGYSLPHFYLFTYNDVTKEGVVLHSQQNQGMPDGLIHFTPTENMELQAGFEAILFP